jgi:hypothetical protein
MLRSTAVAAVLAVSLLSACGSSGSGGATTSKATATAPAPTPAPASSAGQEGVIAKCHQAFDPFIAELRKVDESRKNASDFAAYQEATRKLTSLYSHFNLKAVPSPSCYKAVGDPAAEAYKVHLSAVQSWSQCTKKHGCGGVTAGLKAQWSKATKATDAATKAFATVTAS